MSAELATLDKQVIPALEREQIQALENLITEFDGFKKQVLPTLEKEEIRALENLVSGLQSFQREYHH